MPNLSDAVSRGRSLAGRALRTVRRAPAPGVDPAGRDLRAWPYNIRDLVDVHYVNLQVGALYETAADALERVVQSRARYAVTIHPLIEPAWMLGKPPTSVVDWLRALRTPGAVTELGPLFSLVRAGVGPDDKPFDVLRRFLADATDDTLLPTVDPRLEITWGEAREMLHHRARLFAAHNLRTQRRAREEWDEDEEQAFRATLEMVPVEAPGARPTVSIVMPAYNRAAVIGQAIESVIAQTYQDWELVVVDDGSSDDTREVVLAHAERDPRVRLVPQGRGGVSRARNAGIRASTGRIVAFIDSDNAWRPDFLHLSVSTMRQYDVKITYAGIKRYESHGVIRYVGLQAGRDYLMDGMSFIDLNVLVVDRDLVESVGAFDESLRRWVDFDLVLRLMEHHDAKYVPVVGVDYEHEETTVGRITTSERSTWRDVVLGKYLVDWDAVARAVSDRVPGRVSVLITNRNRWHGTLAAIRSALREADADGADVEVIVVDNASSRDFSAVLAAVFAHEPRVVVHREPNDRGLAVSANIALARSTGEFVLRLSAGAEGKRGWLRALRETLDGDVVAAHGLVLGRDGTVADAGTVFAGAHVAPRAFLRGYPMEDLLRSGRTRFAAGAGSALLVRATDLVRVRGFRAQFGRSLFDTDLCLRLGGGAPSFVLATGAVFHDATFDDDRQQGADTEANSAFLEAWGERMPPADHEWGLAEAGLARAGWSMDAQVGLVPPQRRFVRFSPLRGAIPELRRLPGGPRRWAIKVSTPAAPRGDAWGDSFFAADLAEALRRRGQEVVVDRVEGHFRRTRDIDDVVVTLRGLAKVPPQPGAVNVLWVISHPDLVTDDEIRSFDIVYAAGAEWARQASVRTGVDVRPLLQATSPARFSPDLAAADSGERVVFVGTPRKAMRPIVEHAIAAGHAPAIYGHGWEHYVDAALVREDHVGPDRVGSLYRSAGVVLNDHWEDMARWGFISNRVFDVAAAGGRVVSDHVAGLDEVFQGVVRTYSDPADLVDLLADPSRIASVDDVMRLSEHVRTEHSFDARAAVLVADVDAVRLPND